VRCGRSSTSPSPRADRQGRERRGRSDQTRRSPPERSSTRYWSASARCSSEISAAAARSAMVRATFSTRSWARAEKSESLHRLREEPPAHRRQDCVTRQLTARHPRVDPGPTPTEPSALALARRSDTGSDERGLLDVAARAPGLREPGRAEAAPRCAGRCDPAAGWTAALGNAGAPGACRRRSPRSGRPSDRDSWRRPAEPRTGSARCRSPGPRRPCPPRAAGGARRARGARTRVARPGRGHRGARGSPHRDGVGFPRP
jgi:hypothetical protein